MVNDLKGRKAMNDYQYDGIMDTMYDLIRALNGIRCGGDSGPMGLEAVTMAICGGEPSKSISVTDTLGDGVSAFHRIAAALESLVDRSMTDESDE